MTGKIRMALAISCCLALALSLATGCAGRGPSAATAGGGPGNGGNGGVDFESQIQPIFNRGCACHLSPSPPAGVVLLAGASYDSLVNVPSTQNPSFRRVEPGEPDRSYLVIKIDDSVPDVSSLRVGERMPFGLPPLSAGDIETIRRWIEEGARRSAQGNDVEPPQFAGATLAVAVSSTEIAVFWDPAEDDRTSQEDILYHVFIATAPGAQDFSQPTLAAPAGTDAARIRDLVPGTRYYVVVRAQDAGGNRDDNRTEVTARTLDPPVTPAAVRGDVDGDGKLGRSDAGFLLDYLFLGGPLPVCLPVADGNGDGIVTISDAVFLLERVLSGGAVPPPLSDEEIDECGRPDEGPVERGLTIYRSPDLLGNRFSCSTCHETVPDGQADRLRPGHSLHDALRRPSYNLGKQTRILDAVNVCRESWMRTTPWEESDPSFVDLLAFLEDLSPSDPAPPLVFEISPPATTGPAAGDAQAGCALFHRSCVICHGPGAAGTELAPSLVISPLGANYIRRKVRLSGPTGTVYEGLIGGNMPFWSRDKLSDGEVEDLATYLGERPIRECADE